MVSLETQTIKVIFITRTVFCSVWIPLSSCNFIIHPERGFG